MQRIIVTTVKDKLHLTDLAKGIAVALDCGFVERKERSLEKISEEFPHEICIVVGDRRISAKIGDQEFFFHPSMALLRIMNSYKGEQDRMAQAMGVGPDMTILDCTLGFGTDALVAAFFAGPSGKVTGLESSRVVASLVKHGLKEYQVKLHNGLDPIKTRTLLELPSIMARIEVINASHLDFLKQAAANSYDIVYFDPMFRSPQEDSIAISPLRKLACPNPVDPESILLARRVARHRVVLKESRFSREFERLGFESVPGGKYSPISYGVIELA